MCTTLPQFSASRAAGPQARLAGGDENGSGPGSIDRLREIPAPSPDGEASALSPDASAWLDALRAFLIAQVVLGHFAAMALPEIPELGGRDSTFAAVVVAYRITTRFGAQAAFVFVFLSGFLVGGPLLAARRQGRTIRFASFARRRLARILPTLWIAVCLCACLDTLGAFGLGAAGVYASQRAYDFVAAMTARNFVGNLICLEPTFVEAFGSNGPLWTLGYIVQFYLAGFLLFRLIAWRTGWPLAFAACLLLTALACRPEWACLFAVWCLGAAARVIPAGDRFGSWPSLVVGAALFVAANRAPSLASIFMCGAAGVLVQGWVRATSARLAAAPRRALSWIASLGYETYAVHYPVAFFIFAVCFRERAGDIGTFALFVAAASLVVVLISLTIRRIVALSSASLVGRT
jgi:peptidoglycan/LPS O-acetylase OafA/YrhL